jgi:hypothetical protein
MANRKVNATGRTERTERHVRLTHFLLNSAAYGSLGPAPRALLVEVLKRYTGFNNGSIGLGVREAAAALHVKPQTIGRAFKALQDRGFVAMTRGSSFHQKKLTREWRVTFLPVGDFQSPTSRPTHDYVHWRAPPEKQKPVPFRDTLSAEKGYRSGQPTKSGPVQCPQTALSSQTPAPLSAVSEHPSSYQDSTGARSLRSILPAIVNGVRAA